MKYDPIPWPVAHRAATAKVGHVALLGNYPPRRCGLATYTKDSADALRSLNAAPIVDLYVMDDGEVADYPAEIAMLVAQNDINAYQQAADAINGSAAQVLWIQHEFGIFGGESGSHLLALLNRVEIPVVVTLHTILSEPNDAQRSVMQHLLDRASGVIVMAERGREILAQSFQVDAAKVRVIPHGVPDCALTDAANARRSLGLAERPTVLTFGLLAPDKGIEDAIEAMATIRETVPDVHYIVLGATHPHLLRGEKDVYRTALLERTAALGLQSNVTFLDQFVALEELTVWLAAADVYVTPYRNPAQITSGTLSYAVGLGKAVVSTPYVHANEILADNHGVIVPFRSPAALAEAIGGLLTDDAARTALSARAYERGRSMIWSRNGEAVLKTLSAAVAARLSPRAVITPFGAQVGPIERMTDDTGMFQHSIFGIPDRRHGYCIDDNARGLLLMALAEDLPRATRIRLSNIYASFIQYAWNPDARCFRNFMGYDRNWCEAAGSEDSNGRTLWALGIAAARAPSPALRHWAASLYDQASSMLEPLMSPRARAFAMLGAASMASVGPGNAELERTMREGGAMLTGLLVASRRPDWSWFEVVLSYDNTRLSEALIRAGMALGDKMMVTVGLDTLEWIARQTTGHNGQFQPIGTASFGEPFAAPAVFDQQPLEAWAMIDACAAAQEAMPDSRWAERAAAAYRWFLGDNALSLSLVDLESGECGDGLTPFEVNLNNGAESVIAWQAACRGFSALARHEKDADALEAA